MGRARWRLKLGHLKRTVASYYEELIIVRDVVHGNVWIRGDDLSLWGKIGALLEFKVSNRPRQRQIAVDSAKVDKAASRCDSSLLSCRYVNTVLPKALLILHTFILGLVVKRQRFRSSLDAQNRP